MRKVLGIRRVVRDFSPAWFVVTMGTGVVASLLHQLPYNGTWLKAISICIFLLNIVIFAVMLAVTLARYLLYPEAWQAVLRHDVQPFFLAAFPMGFATIINMAVFVCVPIWQPGIIYVVWAMWWLDIVLSAASSFLLGFKILWTHDMRIRNMSLTWLFPLLPAIVAASSGSIVADVLPNIRHRTLTVIVCYVFWSIGFPAAMALFIVYIHRLFEYGMPPQEQTFSLFLPLGPLGLGAFTLMQLGKLGPKLVWAESLQNIASGGVLPIVSISIAFPIWASGLLWLFVATAVAVRSRPSFGVGWWNITFPGGVYALATNFIGQELDLQFFKVLGTVFSVAVIRKEAMAKGQRP